MAGNKKNKKKVDSNAKNHSQDNSNKFIKSDKIEVEGKVIEVLKGSDYLVELPNGHTVKAYVSGKMRIHMIRILPGDIVTVELSPYDLTRGIITWNKR